VAKAEHVLLVGMAGSGKSTVASLLAACLDRPWVDTDEEVERRTGKTVEAIFLADGEAAFRDEERRVLALALAADTPSVIAVAGGAVLDAGNRRLIGRSGTVIWLRAGTETLIARLGDASGRPLLAADLPAALRELDRARRPLYVEVADAVIDVDSHSPEEVVALVIEAVGARPSRCEPPR
jgi:shikimate kinase